MARLPDRVPQPQPKLGRAIQLPAQLADIRDAKRETGDAADGDVAGGHERKGVVADVGRRQSLENRSGRRSPESDARVRRRDVFDLDRPIAGRVVADPRQVVHPERRPGDHTKAPVVETRDREVALDAPALVQHLGISQRADRAGDPVVGQAFEIFRRAAASHLDLRE